MLGGSGNFLYIGTRNDPGLDRVGQMNDGQVVGNSTQLENLNKIRTLEKKTIKLGENKENLRKFRKT